MRLVEIAGCRAVSHLGGLSMLRSRQVSSSSTNTNCRPTNQNGELNLCRACPFLRQTNTESFPAPFAFEPPERV